MVKRVTLVLFILLSCVSFVFANTITDKQIIDLVKKTSLNIEKNLSQTLEDISNSKHPYTDKDIKSLYVFVYDTKAKLVAHPNKLVLGVTLSGKPDASGKKFRDIIVYDAMINKSGWASYFYNKPGEKGLHKKMTYYNLVTGSDGKKYVVCAGKYLDKIWSYNNGAHHRFRR